MRRLLAATAVVFALAVPTAGAAEIPKGDYVCSNTFGYAGTVNIKRDNKYSVNDGKKAKYSYSRKRKILNFKSGDYKGFFGKYVKKSKGFDVYDNKSGDHLWACYR
jgi:hypothetical protein